VTIADATNPDWKPLAIWCRYAARRGAFSPLTDKLVVMLSTFVIPDHYVRTTNFPPAVLLSMAQWASTIP
jgi:hypothetical protein